MPLIHRILIRTHHMTSRRKILTLTQACKRLSCSVLLKTGSPPGIMLAEGSEALSWLEVVRKLRYKDFRLCGKVVLEMGEDKGKAGGRGRDGKGLEGLGVERGCVKESESVREFGKLLEGDEELFEWWRVGMGFKKGEDAP